ncbi:MAG: NAD(P)/FAD-dependent oxidoreductase [Pseudomonadota bacterium]
MSRHYDTLVLGAGAAGLMCAMTAATRGRRVVVLDRSNRIGKKILMSGGGKCNFTNLYVTPDRFLSANPHFCKSALARYTQWDFIELVERHGIDYFEKETVNGLSGQLFCRESSKQIVAMLRAECEVVGVEILTDCETSSVTRRDGFHLETNLGAFAGDTLVVATGALSIPSLGGSGFGYELAEQFGLELLPRTAGLVPFTFSDEHKPVFSTLSGVSCEVTAENARSHFREDLLFTHRGLSGPCVLQISSYWRPGEAVRFDLLPGEDLPSMLATWKQETPRVLLRTPLGQHLPRKLVAELELLFWPDRAEIPLGEWPDAALAALAAQLSDWSLTPSGTEGYRKAEVTLGGVNTDGLSSKTMEASGTSGLFFIGEVVDVTGHLGGFNFQWAWASGYAAGMAV